MDLQESYYVIVVVIPLDVTSNSCVLKAKSPGKLKLATPTRVPPESEIV